MTQATPLLSTKLTLPPMRPALVARLRLSQLLDQRYPLTLISAPPGFGKTTLLTEWLTDSGNRVAWLSLDADDNEPLTFAAYVSAALGRVLPGVESGLDLLSSSPQPLEPRVIATTWINALSQAQQDVVLALDDYHVIHTPAVHELVTFLLEHRPPRLRLCITTRADPPLPVSRLRARGELLEIRSSDLRFTEDEAAQFLGNVMGLRLTSELLAALNTRTEGWIAGLQLAALSMRGQADVSSFVNAFAGSNAYIVDYLADEVLRQQPAHVVQFLLRTAILDQLNGSLCDAVTLRTDSSAILESLERGNVFVVALDAERKWYRYHHLFRDVLQQRLNSSGEDMLALYRRASDWHERNGNLAESVSFALAAAEPERAARLIEAGAALVEQLGHIQPALAWFAALPEERIRSRPNLCILHASLLTHVSQIHEAEARVQDAERGLELQPDMSIEQVRFMRGRMAEIRAEMARSKGDFAQCVVLARQALDLLPPSETVVRERLSMYVLLNDLFTGYMTPEAVRMQARLTESARASGNRVSYLSGTSTLGWMRLYRGELHKAAANLEQSVAGWEAIGVVNLGISLFSRLGLASILQEWGQTKAAEQHVAHGLAVIHDSATPDANIVWVVGQILTRLGRTQDIGLNVSVRLNDLADVARAHRLGALLESRLAALRAWHTLSQGDLAAASDWASTCDLPVKDVKDDVAIPFQRELEHLILVRIWIAQVRAGQNSGGAQDALQLIDRMLPTAESNFRARSVIEMLVLRALALQMLGDVSGASAALHRALTRAEPGDFLHVFVDEGAPMRTLLRHLHLDDSRLQAYRDRLMAAIAEPTSLAPAAASSPTSKSNQSPNAVSDMQSLIELPLIEPLIEPLSARELEVLGCIHAGLSNREIAAHFVVAPSTVKWYINNLYAKLGVASRTQALARARALGLM